MRITRAAAGVLKSSVQGSEVREESGFRFVDRPDKPGTLAVEIVEQPEAGDEVIEESGIRVFLPGKVAQELADLTLDIDPSADGVALTIR